MSKKQNIFVRSLHELKSTRCIAVTALLIAINITLDLLGLTIKLPPNLRIGFGFLCNAAIGMLFGPVVGMMAGVCTDVLGYFAGNLSMGAYFPGYTLTAVVGGLIDLYALRHCGRLGGGLAGHGRGHARQQHQLLPSRPRRS